MEQGGRQSIGIEDQSIKEADSTGKNSTLNKDVPLSTKIFLTARRRVRANRVPFRAAETIPDAGDPCAFTTVT